MATRKPPPGDVCAQCGKPITNPQAATAVRIASGPVHANCYAELRRKIDRMIADAIRGGTHFARP